MVALVLLQVEVLLELALVDILENLLYQVLGQLKRLQSELVELVEHLVLII